MQHPTNIGIWHLVESGIFEMLKPQAYAFDYGEGKYCSAQGAKMYFHDNYIPF